jgi:hypothetical protein
MADIDGLLDESGHSGSTRKKLKAARKDLARALKYLNKDEVKKALLKISNAVTDLVKVADKVANADALIDQLVESAKLKAQAAIDAAVAATPTDAALIAAAEADMITAQSLLDRDKPSKAIKRFRSAWTNADKAILPDILGTYVGTYSNKVTGCKRKKDNGKYKFTIAMEVTGVDGPDFTGTAVGTVNLGGFSLQEFISFAGRIDADGRIDGKTSHTFLGTTGKGSFTGELSDNKLTVLNKGKDKTGDTCKYTRKIKVALE